MRDAPPTDAIPIERELPPNHVEVLGWVSDDSVAIHHFPTVVRRDDTAYWGGVPGKWIALHNENWTLTHWRHIAPQQQ